MKTYDFTPPICLNCGIALESKKKYDAETNTFREIKYCPNCEEIY